MKNFIIAVIVIILIAGGVWWYLNGVPGTSSADKMTVVLSAQNASGISGKATLTEVSKEVQGVAKKVVELSIKVSGAEKDAVQPAHIHIGSCAALGQPVFPLSPITNGVSVTEIDTTLDQIKAASQPLAISVKKSEAELGTYVSCGDLVVKDVAPAATASTATQ